MNSLSQNTLQVSLTATLLTDLIARTPAMGTAQQRSVRTLVATAKKPQSRDIFIIQKILPLDKLNNQ